MRDDEISAGRAAGDAIDRLADAVAHAVTTEQVAEAAAEQIRTTFDAALVLVTLADEQAGGLLSLGASGRRDRDLGAEPLLPFSTPTLMTDAYREDGPLVLHREEYVVRYPHMAASIPDSRIVMAVGHRFLGPAASGAVSISFAAERSFTDDDELLLVQLLSQLPDAFARTRAADRDRQATLALQRSLLPGEPLASFAEWQVAARYCPARDDARIGGDWFDFFPLGAHRLAITIGDVAGKGHEAAETMGWLRLALRSSVQDAERPGRALEELEQSREDLDGAFASTVIVASIDRERYEVSMAVAGNVPPMVATADGVRTLRSARGAPLGLGALHPRREATMTLEEEETIVFYTDGLVVHRGEAIEDGLARLADTFAAQRDEPLQSLVDVLVEASSGEDDVAVVALRRVGARPRTFSTLVRSEARNIRVVRNGLRSWLEGIGAPGPLLEDLLVVVSEAMANARDHAYQGADDGEIVVVGRVRDRRVELAVRDRGRWAPSVRSPVRGRGVSIMEALTDECRLVVTPEGIEVQLAVALDRDAR